MNISDWKLCLVADVEAAQNRDIISLTMEAVKAGVTIVQLRAKKLDANEFFQLAVKMKSVLSHHNIPFIINDRVDIAKACNATGVHLGQKDLPLAEARKIMGNDKIIGISVNSIEETEKAGTGGADYLGAGPIFPTASKEDLDPFLGMEGLKVITQNTTLPVLAIGGIGHLNAPDVIKAGAEGIAVISAILGEADPAEATRRLAHAVSNRDQKSNKIN